MRTTPPARQRPTDPVDPIVQQLLHTVRDERFSGGVYCPRCGCRRVQGWGRFLGRRRYRCTGCSRTFSDLTRTPFAYSKRLEQWPAYVQCIEASFTVRRAAAITSLHISTAFRWRHLLLDSVFEGECIHLRDKVEVRASKTYYSNKGQRRRKDRNLRGANVSVLWARDERGVGIGDVYLTWDFNTFAYDGILLPFLDDHCTVASPGGRLGSVALFCRRNRLKWEQQTSHDLRTSPLSRQMAGFFRWVKRFRGVATSYLGNYLAWYRMIGSGGELRSFRRWFVAALPPPTIAANTG